MRVLIAEDSRSYRKILASNLHKCGYELIQCSDGDETWDELMKNDAPQLIILDWMMPGKSGVDICRDLRKLNDNSFRYIILQTSCDNQSDIIEGLEAGADDYIIKPYNYTEFEHRVKAGARIVKLELSLQKKINELQNALDNVKQLQGFLPICAWCKKIRDDKQYWHSLENYLEDHSDAVLSHGICPDCRKEHFPQYII
jgi:DNA-binding response OmpR family regulator